MTIQGLIKMLKLFFFTPARDLARALGVDDDGHFA